MPYLDQLTRRGKIGYVHTVAEDIAPESDIAVTALLGYDPYTYYTGRGPLEAYGAHIPYKNGWIALRTNFSTVNEKMRLVSRRAGRTLPTRDARALARLINTKVKLAFPFTFHATVAHRGVLVIQGNFSENISNVDPAYAKKGSFGVAVKKRSYFVQKCVPLDRSAKSRYTAAVINDFVQQSYQVLKNSTINKRREETGAFPANIVIPRDAGVSLPRFPQKKGWAAVISMPLEIGLAKLAGMRVLPFTYPKMRGRNVYKHLYKGLRKTIKASIKALKKNEYKTYYLHFKEIDVAGHDNEPHEKQHMLEVLDKTFFRYLTTLPDTEIIVTGDHSTPCEMRGHSNDPVPLLYISKGIPDGITKLSEKTMKLGSLGKMKGKDVLKQLQFR